MCTVIFIAVYVSTSYQKFPVSASVSQVHFYVPKRKRHALHKSPLCTRFSYSPSFFTTIMIPFFSLQKLRHFLFPYSPHTFQSQNIFPFLLIFLVLSLPNLYNMDFHPSSEAEWHVFFQQRDRQSRQSPQLRQSALLPASLKLPAWIARFAHLCRISSMPARICSHFLGHSFSTFIWPSASHC